MGSWCACVASVSECYECVFVVCGDGECKCCGCLWCVRVVCVWCMFFMWVHGVCGV